MLFGIEYLKVSVFQAGALFLVSWIMSLCLDFISGGVADTQGRKKTFIFGMTIQILGMVPFVVTKNYTILLVASAITGIGMALVSNALSALLYEQAKELDSTKIFQRGVAHAGAFSYAGRVVASIVGGVVYLLNPTLPYALTIGGLAMALFAGVAMTFPGTIERNIKNKTSMTTLKSAWSSFTSDPSLIKFAVVIGLISIWGDFLFTSYQPYFAHLNVSPIILGYLYAGLSLLSAAGSLLMRHLPEKFSASTINNFVICGMVATPILLLFDKLPLVYFAPAGLALVSAFTGNNIHVYVNNRAPNNIRVSLLSIVTTISGIGSGIGIFVVLQLIGAFDFRTIMTICIVGCVATMLINVFGKHFIAASTKLF